jgi:hypothetical protein
VEGFPIALNPRSDGTKVRVAGHQSDPTVAQGDQVAGSFAGCCHVVCRHAVKVDVPADPIQEDGGNISFAQLLEHRGSSRHGTKINPSILRLTSARTRSLSEEKSSWVSAKMIW